MVLPCSHFYFRSSCIGHSSGKHYQAGRAGIQGRIFPGCFLYYHNRFCVGRLSEVACRKRCHIVFSPFCRRQYGIYNGEHQDGKAHAGNEEYQEFPCPSCSSRYGNPDKGQQQTVKRADQFISNLIPDDIHIYFSCRSSGTGHNRA